MFLSRFAGGAATGVALDSANASEKLHQQLLRGEPEIADALVTPTQRARTPRPQGMLGIPKEDREHRQWQFGRPVRLVDDRKVPPGRKAAARGVPR